MGLVRWFLLEVQRLQFLGSIHLAGKVSMNLKFGPIWKLVQVEIHLENVIDIVISIGLTR